MIRFLPGAVIGIGVGWSLFQFLSPDGLRIGIGFLALYFFGRHVFSTLRKVPETAVGLAGGQVLGAVSGLGSFVAHAGVRWNYVAVAHRHGRIEPLALPQ